MRGKEVDFTRYDFAVMSQNKLNATFIALKAANDNFVVANDNNAKAPMAAAA